MWDRSFLFWRVSMTMLHHTHGTPNNWPRTGVFLYISSQYNESAGLSVWKQQDPNTWLNYAPRKLHLASRPWHLARARRGVGGLAITGIVTSLLFRFGRWFLLGGVTFVYSFDDSQGLTVPLVTSLVVPHLFGSWGIVNWFPAFGGRKEFTIMIWRFLVLCWVL